MRKRRDEYRHFCATDRPGEAIAVSRPLAGVQILSVRHSNRHWREAHAGFTIAAIHRDQGELIAEWRTRGRALASERGGLMSIEPGDVHVTERLKTRQGAASFDVVQLSSEIVTEACLQLGMKGNFHFRTPAATDPIAFDAVTDFVEIASSRADPLSLEAAQAQLLTSVLTRLSEVPSGSCTSLDPQRDFRLRRVRDYLAANLLERPTLGELEKVSGLCRFRLCALFKRGFGTSVGAYWNTLRLGQAVQRLEQGESIKLLLAELGYLDASYFSRVFKCHYGIPPGEWRSMFRANDQVRGRRERPEVAAG